MSARRLRITTIRGKLFASYALVIVLPILLIGGFFFQRVNALMLKGAFDAERRALQQVHDRFHAVLETCVEIADQIYLNERLARYFRARYLNEGGSAEGYYTMLQPLFSQYRAMHPEIRRITVYTDNPTMLVNGAELDRAVDGAESAALLRGATEAQGRIQWHSAVDGDLVLYRLLNLHNTRTGMLVIAVGRGFLRDLLGPLGSAGEWHIAMDTGRIVASTLPGVTGSQVRDTLWSGLPPFGATADTPGQRALEGERGVTALVADIQPEDRSTTGWRILRTVSTGAVLGDLRRTLALAAIICLSILVLALLGGTVVAARISGRVRALEAGMGRLREGDFLARVPATPADEIGRLGAHFNEMAERLSRLVGEVHRMEIQKRDMEIKRREAELYALESQLNPHFLFNTLEALISGIDEGRAGTSETLLLLARCLRRNLHFTEGTIPLGDELLFVTEYLRICQFRMEEKLTWDLDVPPDTRSAGVPRFILQPIVENAVLHGIALRKGPGRILVAARREDGELQATVHDDGQGMESGVLEAVRRTLRDPESAPAGEHIGLRNVAARLKYTYGDRARVAVESRPGEGATFTLRLPVAPEG